MQRQAQADNDVKLRAEVDKVVLKIKNDTSYRSEFNKFLQDYTKASSSHLSAEDKKDIQKQIGSLFKDESVQKYLKETRNFLDTPADAFVKEYNQHKVAVFQQKLSSLHTGFQFCTMLGAQLEDKNLQKIGVIAQSALQVCAGCTELFAASSPLLAIGPLGAVAMGVLAVVSIFTKDKSSPQSSSKVLVECLTAINDQMRFIHADIRKLFDINSEYQRMIYEKICDRFSKLEALVSKELRDLKLSHRLSFDTLQSGIDRISDQLTFGFQANEIQPFEAILTKSAIQRKLTTRDGAINHKKVDLSRIKSIHYSLANWAVAGGNSTNRILNGVDLMNGLTIGNSYEFTSKKLNNQSLESLSSLTGYLAVYAGKVLGLKPRVIKKIALDKPEEKKIEIKAVEFMNSEKQIALNRKLHQAARDGDEVMLLDALRNGAEIEAKDDGTMNPTDGSFNAGYVDYTPVLTAAINGQVRMVEVLISYGANINATNKHAQKLLFLSALSGKLELIEFLVCYHPELIGSQINATVGHNPLHACVYHNNATALKIYLELGADKGLTDQQNKTAQMVADESNRPELATILRNYQPSGKYLTQVNFEHVFNPRIWGHAVEEYYQFFSHFIDYDLDFDEDDKQLDKIVAAGENFINFILLLQKNPSLFQQLFDDYQNALNEIKAYVNKVMNETHQGSGLSINSDNYIQNSVHEAMQVTQHLPSSYSMRGTYFHSLPQMDPLKDRKHNIDQITFDASTFLNHIRVHYPSLILAQKMGQVEIITDFNVRLESLSYRNDISSGADHNRIAYFCVDMHFKHSVHNATLTFNYAVDVNGLRNDLYNGSSLGVDKDTAECYVFPIINNNLNDAKIADLMTRYCNRKSRCSISLNNVNEFVGMINSHIPEWLFSLRSQSIRNIFQGGHDSFLQRLYYKLDASAHLLKAYAKLAGFRDEENTLINSLWSSDQIKSHFVTYINGSSTNATDFPTKNLGSNVASIRSAIINKLCAFNPDYFQSKFSIFVSSYLTKLKFVNVRAEFRKVQQASQEADSQFVVDPAVAKYIDDMIENYTALNAGWRDLWSAWFEKLPDTIQDTDSYKQCKKYLHEMKNVFKQLVEKHEKCVDITEDFTRLRGICGKIHFFLKGFNNSLPVDYKYRYIISDEDVYFLHDKAFLKMLEKYAHQLQQFKISSNESKLEHENVAFAMAPKAEAKGTLITYTAGRRNSNTLFNSLSLDVRPARPSKQYRA